MLKFMQLFDGTVWVWLAKSRLLSCLLGHLWECARLCKVCVLWGQQSARAPLRSPVCPCPVFPRQLGLLLHLTFPLHSSSATSHPRRASLGGSQGLWVQNVCTLVLPAAVRHTDQWRLPSPAQGLWLPGSAVSWHHGLPEHWSLYLWGGKNACCPLRVGGRMQGAKTFVCLPGTSRDRWWAFRAVASALPIH